MRRLDQLLSARGYGSRKEVAALLRGGAARVNGEVCRSGAQKIDPAQDTVTLGGQTLDLREVLYLMLHKPQGVISASRDPHAATVLDLVPQQLRRRDLFPVGRLDKDATGLLLLTNDGALAHALLSPRRHVPKVYLVQLRAPVSQGDIAAFAAGLSLTDEACLPAELSPLDHNRARVVLQEGKYHQVKRMFHARGNEVLALHRESMGPLRLDPALSPGACRELTTEELLHLKENMF